MELYKIGYTITKRRKVTLYNPKTTDFCLKSMRRIEIFVLYIALTQYLQIDLLKPRFTIFD